MNTRASVVGLGLGAGLMYLLDPARGNRRRALIRDKMARAARTTREAADATGRDLRNRWEGTAALVESRFRDDPAGDRVIAERVRAQLGRVSSHPRAISVAVSGTTVMLSGDVLASEVPLIVSAAENVRGVETVNNQMQVYHSAEGVPSLQGGSARPGWWSTWFRSGWSPTARLAAGVGSAAALVVALAARRRGMQA